MELWIPTPSAPSISSSGGCICKISLQQEFGQKRKLHINILEMKVVQLALGTFFMAHLKKQEEIVSLDISRLAGDKVGLSELLMISISAIYIPVKKHSGNPAKPPPSSHSDRMVSSSLGV